MHVRREKSLFAKSDRISTTQFSLLLSRLLYRSVPNGQKSDPFFALLCHMYSPSFRVPLSVDFFYFPYLRQISDVGVGPLVKKKKG